MVDDDFELPPLYKYLDFRGAFLTLSRRTFKYSRPSDFNDLEDLTIRSIYPEAVEDALTRVERGFTEIVMRNLDREPTCDEPRRTQMRQLQAIYREDPRRAAAVQAALEAEGHPPVFDREYMRRRSDELLVWVNEFMQGFRVFCATTHLNSEVMWRRYGQNHTGIIVRIQPNLERDSVFRLLRPVEYRSERPSLYADTLDFVSESFFGDPQASRLEMIRRVIHSKTNEWSYEGEYRVAVALREGEALWDTLRFHANEITELHFGADITPIDKTVLQTIVTLLNPSVILYQVQRGERDRLISVKI